MIKERSLNCAMAEKCNSLPLHTSDEGLSALNSTSKSFQSCCLEHPWSCRYLQIIFVFHNLFLTVFFMWKRVTGNLSYEWAERKEVMCAHIKISINQFTALGWTVIRAASFNQKQKIRTKVCKTWTKEARKLISL